MRFNKCNCSVCERDLYDGETVYNIHGELICEDCISTFTEVYEEEDPELDDLIDEMRDLRNGW